MTNVRCGGWISPNITQEVDYPLARRLHFFIQSEAPFDTISLPWGLINFVCNLARCGKMGEITVPLPSDFLVAAKIAKYLVRTHHILFCHSLGLLLSCHIHLCTEPRHPLPQPWLLTQDTVDTQHASNRHYCCSTKSMCQFLYKALDRTLYNFRND